MTPLTAANTRIDLTDTNLNQALKANTQVILKFTNGVQFTPADLRKILSRNGLPEPGPVPARYSYDLDFGLFSQLLPNPAFDANATGYQAQGGATVAQSAVAPLSGAGCLLVTAANTAGSGVGLTAGVTVNPSTTVEAGIWVKCSAYTGGLSLILRELNAAGGTIASDTTTTVTVDGNWNFHTASKAFSSLGVAAQLFVVGTATPAALQTFQLDNCYVAQQFAGWSNLTNTTLNPVLNQEGAIVCLNLNYNLDSISFDPLQFYDILDQVYATVATDKDRAARNSYLYTIS